MRKEAGEWDVDAFGGERADRVDTREIEEAVGEDATVVVVLSTNDLYVGYHPSNREVKDLSSMLKRKPCWWAATD